ncbi:MAG: thiamine-phosphate kinase [Kiritimatiellaeota bacterium]|nr:thiamine-phosphate kinase [Kiritimatiellota bacterium]
MRTVEESGEVGLIAMIRRWLPPGDGSVVVGSGDDCAVVRGAKVEGGKGGEEIVLKSDPVIEGRHFVRGASAGKVGHKAVGRVLSDFAAMGAVPRWLLANLVLRPDTSVEYVRKLCHGMSRLAARFGAVIVGGDVSQGRDVAVHVFGCGTVPKGKAVLRSGARAGDAVYVTGQLGGSLRGRHLSFTPRLAEGVFLRDYASAMMDVSDGLASDARHLAVASGVTVALEARAIPCAPGVSLRGALCDGEDFELLFTVPRRRVVAFEAAWGKAFARVAVRRIGTVAGRTHRSAPTGDGCCGVLLDGRALGLHGYDHFC